jgi:hypothetical protein
MFSPPVCEKPVEQGKVRHSDRTPTDRASHGRSNIVNKQIYPVMRPGFSTHKTIGVSLLFRYLALISIMAIMAWTKAMFLRRSPISRAAAIM